MIITWCICCMFDLFLPSRQGRDMCEAEVLALAIFVYGLQCIAVSYASRHAFRCGHFRCLVFLRPRGVGNFAASVIGLVKGCSRGKCRYILKGESF